MNETQLKADLIIALNAIEQSNHITWISNHSTLFEHLAHVYKELAGNDKELARLFPNYF